MESYLNQPCERCGSKRIVSRTWQETIVTLMGTSVVECSQIVCTNAACQEAFNKVVEIEEKKRAVQRQKKEENDAERKKRTMQMIKTAKKKNSRI